MAINTTGNNGSVVGVTGVHPDNLNINSFEFKDGKYEVKLSKGAGNLLEQRIDGLYYGLQAPADTANLYVSSVSGNDNNAGTIDSPLKTIDAAWRKNRTDQSATIWLKAGETFEISSNLDAHSGAIKTISVYGTPLAEPPAPLDSERYLYRPEALTNFPRPTIRLKDNYNSKHVRRGETASFWIYSGATVNIIGVNLYLGKEYHYSELHTVFGGEPALGYWSHNMFYGEQGVIKLFGCNVVIPETDKGHNSLSAISSDNPTSCHHVWYGVKVLDQRKNKTTYHLIVFGNSQSIFCYNEHQGYSLDVHKAWGFPESTYQVGNIDAFLKAGNYVNLRMTDPNKSYPINISTNIDFS